MYSTFLTGEIPDGGWFAYTPLTELAYSPGRGIDFWGLGVTFVGASGPTRGFWLWYATLAGIVLWLVYLTALSALAETSCAHPRAEWSMHVLTVVLAALTVVAMRMSWSLVRGRSASDESDPDLDGRLRFMGVRVGDRDHLAHPHRLGGHLRGVTWGRRRKARSRSSSDSERCA